MLIYYIVTLQSSLEFAYNLRIINVLFKQPKIQDNKETPIILIQIFLLSLYEIFTMAYFVK